MLKQALIDVKKFHLGRLHLLIQIPVDISLTLESTQAIGGVKLEVDSYNSQSK